MSDREMVRLLFRSLAAAQKTAKMGIAGWRGQYLYKDDVPGEYYEKLVADLAGPTAVLTHSYASEGQAPEISMFTLV